MKTDIIYAEGALTAYFETFSFSTKLGDDSDLDMLDSESNDDEETLDVEESLEHKVCDENMVIFLTNKTCKLI